MACRTVSYSDNIDLVLFNKVFDYSFRSRNIALRGCRIHYRCVKNLACSVNNGYLTACSVAGIEAESNAVLHRRLHKKLS